jgi:uncharacterized protein
LTSAHEHVIGLIADTHGLVRPGVHVALADVEMILHAGDVGGDDVLEELALIAPVRAVAGNTDPPGELTNEIVCTIGAIDVHVSHGHELGVPTPEQLLDRYTQRVLIYGHTHRPLITRVDRRLVVNPGAAGPRRFSLPSSVGRLRVRGQGVEAEIVEVPGTRYPVPRP